MTHTTEVQAPADESRLRGEPAPHQTNYFSDEEWRRVGSSRQAPAARPSPIMGISGGYQASQPRENRCTGFLRPQLSSHTASNTKTVRKRHPCHSASTRIKVCPASSRLIGNIQSGAYTSLGS